MTKLFFVTISSQEFTKTQYIAIVVFQNFPMQKQKVNKISPELSK